MAENELPEPESVKLFEGMTGGDSDSIPTYDVVIKIRRYTRKFPPRPTGTNSR